MSRGTRPRIGTSTTSAARRSSSFHTPRSPCRSASSAKVLRAKASGCPRPSSYAQAASGASPRPRMRAETVSGVTPGWSASSRTSASARSSTAPRAAAIVDEHPSPNCVFSTTSMQPRFTAARTPSALPPITQRSWSNAHARAVSSTWSSSVASPNGSSCFACPSRCEPPAASTRPATKSVRRVGKLPAVDHGDIDGRAAPAADAHLLRHLLRMHGDGEDVAAAHADVVVGAVAAEHRTVDVLLQRGSSVLRHLAGEDLAHLDPRHQSCAIRAAPSELRELAAEVVDQRVEDADHDPLAHRCGLAGDLGARVDVPAPVWELEGDRRVRVALPAGLARLDLQHDLVRVGVLLDDFQRAGVGQSHRAHLHLDLRLDRLGPGALDHAPALNARHDPLEVEQCRVALVDRLRTGEGMVELDGHRKDYRVRAWPRTRSGPRAERSTCAPGVRVRRRRRVTIC